MKKFISALLVVMMLVSMLPANVFAAETATATMSFASTAQRVSLDGNSQVWKNAGIVFTNNKASSSNDVADYSNPIRIYAKSEIVIEHEAGPISQIVIASNATKYNDPIQTSLKNAGVTSTLSGNNITVNFAPAVESFTFSASAQIRFNSLTVTYEIADEGACIHEGYETYEGEDAVAATCTSEGKTATVYCSNCNEPVQAQQIIPMLPHNIVDGACADCGAKAYALVTDITKLHAGSQIVIVATEADFTISTTQGNNNRPQAAVTKSEDGTTVSFGEDAQVLTIEAGVEVGTYAFNTGSGYLYAAGGTGSNYLRTKAELDALGSWTIEIGETGIATIKAADAATTRNWIRYNDSSKIFSCYASGQKDVAIYILPVAEEPDVECDHLGYETYEGNDYVAPTCTTVGFTATVYCSNCDAVVKEPEELPVSHEGFETYIEGAVEPGCETEGATGTTYCSNCDEVVTESEVIPATGHNYVDGTCENCGDKQATATTGTATITFDDKSKRTTFTTSQQVWEENGVTVTNDKASSTNNIGDYAAPARFYKSSTVAVAFSATMTQIVFDCASTEYASSLKASITSGGTVTVDSDKVTVVLDTPATSFTTGGMSAQVRVDSVTVTYAAAADECLHENTYVDGYVAPTCTTEGATGTTICSDCQEVVKESADLPVIDHSYGADGVCTACGATTAVATLMTELPKTNDVVLIYHIGGNVMAGTMSGNKIGAVSATASNGSLVVTDDMGQIIVRALGNDQYAFVVGDKFVTSDVAGNSMSLEAELSECGKWTFEAEGTTAGTYYIRNVGANHNGNYNQALEYYSGFTTYGIKTTDAYKMQLYFVKAIECTHPSSTQQDDAVEPTCVKIGYTASSTCDVCGAVTTEPDIIPATGIHIYENDSCTMCRRVNPNSSLVAGLMTSMPLAGDEVIIYSSGYLMTGTVSGKKLAGVAVDAPVDGKIPYNADVLVMTVSIDEAGYYIFQNAEGAYLTSGETGNLLTFAAELTDYAKWTIQSADSGESWYIVNKSATYNDIGQALEYYGGFTSYTIDFSNDAFKMQIGLVYRKPAVVEMDGVQYSSFEEAYAYDPDTTIKLLADFDEINVTGDLYLDLNGHTVGSVTANAVYAGDSSATAEAAGTGKLTTTSEVIVDNLIGDVRYIALKDEHGVYTFHVLDLKLSNVTLRTNKAGIYYKGEMACDEVLAAQIDCHGIAVSIVGMPTADFANEANTAATKIYGAPSGVFTSGSVTNIFREDLSAEKNAARGGMAIYGNSYIQLIDGTVLMGSNQTQQSLMGIMQYLDTNYASLEAEDQANALAFYETWADAMVQWGLDNLAAAVLPSDPDTNA